MLSYAQAIIMGALQGIAELFPISSLGHSVLLPGILGWHIDQQADFFLIFLVATHFATALVLFIFYWRDWVRILKGMWRSLKAREISDADPDAKLGWLIVISTSPAGIAGLVFEKQVRDYFLSPRSAALFLLLNGLLLFAAERLRRRARTAAEAKDADQRIAKELSWRQAIKVGVMQVLALIPGFSRTGSTIAGGLLAGLSHEDALRYSFLLATPIIAAAALLKLPELSWSSAPDAAPVALVGALCAAGAAYFAVRFLTKYFKAKTLTSFAIYCTAAGAAALAYLLARG